MPKANPLSPDQVYQLIKEDVTSRVLAMICQGLDEDLVRHQVKDSAAATRVVASMNWARLLLGRMFLELLGWRPSGYKKHDVTITELGGKPIAEDSVTPAERQKLDAFFGHADKIAHLTMAPGRPADVTAEVNEAIPIIVRLLERNLFAQVGMPSPVPESYRQKHGLIH